MAAALAQVEPSYRRIDDVLSVRTGHEVRGDGPARVSGRRGAIRAWVFPDGHVEHYLRTENGIPAELIRYDSRLAKHVSVIYAESRPASVVVHATPPHTVAVQDWSELELEEARLRLPSGSDPAAGVSVGEGRFRAQWTPLDEIRGTDLLDDLEQSIGGRVIANDTVWIDGAAGVRITLDVPHPTAPMVAEAWAIPRDQRLFLATWTAPRGDAPLSLDTLATGRAAMALVTWQGTR